MNTGAKKFFVLVFVFLLTFNNSPTYASTPKVFKLGSESFSEGNQLPSKYTCDGLSVSPPLTWSNEPKGTKYFAITMYTIPREGPAHWYFSIWNIPSKIHNLKESNLSIGNIGGNTIVIIENELYIRECRSQLLGPASFIRQLLVLFLG